jgi:hypothetical protein
MATFDQFMAVEVLRSLDLLVLFDDHNKTFSTTPAQRPLL